MNFKLFAGTSFSLKNLIESHGWSALAPFKTDAEKSTITYLLQLNCGQVIKILLKPIPDGVDIFADSACSENFLDEIKEKVSWMLGMEHNLSPFYDIAKNEPKLAKALQKKEGRMLRSATFFEDTVKMILTTNTSWAGTIRMVNALVDQLGLALDVDHSQKAFPNPVQIAQSNETVLTEEIRLGYRAPAILKLARDIESGLLDLESFKNSVKSSEEIRSELLTIKGIGPYAASALLTLLGRYDYLPIDSWALKLVSTEWYDGNKISKKDVENAFEKWGEWKSLVFWFWDWQYKQSKE